MNMMHNQCCEDWGSISQENYRGQNSEVDASGPYPQDRKKNGMAGTQ